LELTFSPLLLRSGGARKQKERKKEGKGGNKKWGKKRISATLLVNT
jgi:hypothetical protein